MPKDEEQKKLDEALAAIEKLYGEGTITTLESDKKLAVKVIPTGSLAVDVALGVGGVPRGRIVEIAGPESMGKTTLALHIIAEAQKEGGRGAFIDAEHALDTRYARAIGVDTNKLLVSQPNNGEEALEIVDLLVRSGAVDVIVVDSVAALVPKAELEGDFGAAQMGLQARLMSQACRKLVGVTSKSKCCLIFINQIREKIGVLFGSNETLTGGRALKFYSSIRMDIRRVKVMKDGEESYGNETRCRIIKNKCAVPHREAEIEIIFGEGISKETDLLTLGEQNGIIDRAGTWFSFGGERIGQGKDNAVHYLKTNPDIAAEIERLLREKYFGKREQ